MVGIQQESPLEFWSERIKYLIDKSKIRNDLAKERSRHINKPMSDMSN